VIVTPAVLVLRLPAYRPAASWIVVPDEAASSAPCRVFFADEADVPAAESLPEG
jgi:hypothetical protein